MLRLHFTASPLPVQNSSCLSTNTYAFLGDCAPSAVSTNRFLCSSHISLPCQNLPHDIATVILLIDGNRYIEFVLLIIQGLGPKFVIFRHGVCGSMLHGLICVQALFTDFRLQGIGVVI